jgi:hypothetical protein
MTRTHRFGSLLPPRTLLDASDPEYDDETTSPSLNITSK